MKLQLAKASTDVTVNVFIQDSSSATGAGLTGLAYDTSSLVCYYARHREAAAQLTLATQTVTGAHSDGGFVEVDATNMPGVYRLDLSDAICATGDPHAMVMLKGAADMAPLPLEIQLTDFDMNASLTLAQITTEISDSWVTDTMAELSQAQPPKNPTPVQALMLHYMALRDKRATTSSEDAIYNDAGTKIAKATVSDDGTTTTRAKFGSGA